MAMLWRNEVRSSSRVVELAVLLFSLLPLLVSTAVTDDAEVSEVSDCDGYDSPSCCSLYFTESSVQPGRYGLYAAEDRSVGEPLADPELFWPVVDANKNEWSPWHDMAWSAESFPRSLGESLFLIDLLYPGVATMLACSSRFSNVVVDGGETLDPEGVHRSRHASAGSWTYYGNSTFRLSRPVQAGEELVLPCAAEDGDAGTGGRKVLDSAFLRTTALCLRPLQVRPSTIPGAGRGAFAANPVRQGHVIATSPVLHMDRSQTDVVHQDDYPYHHDTPYRRTHDILYNNSLVVGKQILHNYCYGHPSSHVLLLPYGPAVNFINHGGRSQANAQIRWSNEPFLAAPRLKALRPLPLFSTAVGAVELLAVEYVATRDIGPGEEILLDYGDAWEAAWNRHVDSFNPVPSAGSYQSAVDYLRAHPGEPVRTIAEQQLDPYPENMQTVCFYSPPSDYDPEYTLEWSDDDLGCLRPCEIRERTAYEVDDDDEPTNGYYYTVDAYNSDHSNRPESCGDLPSDAVMITDVPHRAVTLLDRPYTSDLHLPGAFRHEVGLPDSFVPEAWKSADPEPHGDFARRPLVAGELDRMSWKETGEPATPWAFRVGLPSSLRQVLLAYCQKKGILQMLRHVTVEGNGLLPGQESNLMLDGQEWFLQRPGAEWSSNLHWLSPHAEPAHNDYLQALRLGGFDDVLRGIGSHLELDGLVAYHVTFIGVSYAHKGFLHTDVMQTDGKAYNVIVPLLLASESGPELDVAHGVDRSGDRVGRYKYEYDVGAMMGDDCFHATSAVDYRHSREMRLAATIYIADVNERNAKHITDEYTQAYPPRNADLLLSWAGRHWLPNDPTRTLPDPSPDHILLRYAGSAAAAALAAPSHKFYPISTNATTNRMGMGTSPPAFDGTLDGVHRRPSERKEGGGGGESPGW